MFVFFFSFFPFCLGGRRGECWIYYHESHFRGLYSVSVSKFHWTFGLERNWDWWQENALKLLSKLVLRWAIFPILFCFLFLPFWIFVMICTSDNVFIYSAKGHVREWSCNGLTYPLVLAFRKNHLSLSSFLLTAVGSFITRNMVRFFSF